MEKHPPGNNSSNGESTEAQVQIIVCLGQFTKTCSKTPVRVK